MKTTKVPKLKPEEKEQIIKNHFQKIEGEKRLSKVMTHALTTIALAFLVVTNILAVGVLFIAASITKSSFGFMLSMGVMISAVIMCHSFVEHNIKKNKKR